MNRVGEPELSAPNRQRRAFLQGALASGLLVGGLGWNEEAFAALFGQRPRRLPPGQSVFDLNGRVFVNGARASRDTPIQAGDEVRVERGGHAIFAVGDNAYILRERSVLELSGRDLLVHSMRLLSGAMLGVFGRRRAEPLGLNTVTASVGIRGTGLYAEAREDRTYLCTCYGTTDLAAADEPTVAETISAIHHDAPRWIMGADAGKDRIRPAPFINHTDLELATIEALVGREVPFGIRESPYRGPRRNY